MARTVRTEPVEVTEIDLDAIPATTRKDSASAKQVQSFLESGAKAVELSVTPDNIASVRGTLQSYMKRQNVTNIEVLTRGDRLFLKRLTDQEVAAAKAAGVEPGEEVTDNENVDTDVS